MGHYQKMFETILEEQFSDHRCIELAMQDHLRNLEVGLSDDNINTIAKKLAIDPTATIQLNDLSSDTDAEVKICLTEQDLQCAVEKIARAIPDRVRSTVEKIAPAILGTMDASSQQTLSLLKEDLHSFHANINHAWGPALDALELYINASHEARSNFIEDFKEWDSERQKDSGNRSAALIRIHMRACRTAAEILCLLRAGFSDGASARWRSLHELAVISMYLAEQPDYVSAMYLDHSAVEQMKNLDSYIEHCEALGREPLEDDTAESLRDRRDGLLQQYGAAFKGDYGWASCYRGEKRTTFSDIEQSVQLNHWRPYYQLACQSIHAGSRACFFSLGALSDGDLPSAQTLVGLTDPGQNCAISLSMASVALLTFESTIDQLVIAEVLALMCGRVTEAFAGREAFLDEHLIEIPEDLIHDADD